MQRGLTIIAFRLVILVITLAAAGLTASCADVETANYRRLISRLPREMKKDN